MPTTKVTSNASNNATDIEQKPICVLALSATASNSFP